MQRIIPLVIALSAAVIVGSTYLANLAWPALSDHVFNQSERTEAVKRLVDKWEEKLLSSRYMKKNGTCTPVQDYSGWEGFPLEQCSYTKNGIKASVIMLNPSAEQIARWVVDACYEAGHPEPEYMDKLYAHIICQSNGQFPVAGIVLEDMDGNGKPNNYCFRNGMTVNIEGLFTDSTVTSAGKKKRDQFPERQTTEDEIQKCYQGKVEKVWKFARIQSTSREDYMKADGTLNVKGKAWMEVVQKLYKQAWGKNRNELMIAWAKQHLTNPVTLKSDPCLFCLLYPEKCRR